MPILWESGHQALGPNQAGNYGYLRSDHPGPVFVAPKLQKSGRQESLRVESHKYENRSSSNYVWWIRIRNLSTSNIAFTIQAAGF